GGALPGLGAALAAACAAVPSTTVAGCGFAARHDSYWRCTSAAAAAALRWSTRSRVGMRRIAPALRLLMLFLKNASGLAAFNASIIWSTLASDPWIAPRARAYSVSPRWTSIVPGDDAGCCACGVAG